MSGLSAQKTSDEMVSIPRYVLEDSPALAGKLKKFADAEERAKKAIALMGAADEILGLRDQAKAERDAADVASAETKETCAVLVSDAIAQAEDIVEEARNQAAGMLDGASVKLESAQRVEVDAQQMMQKAQEASSVSAASLTKLDQRAQELTSREAALEEQQTLLLKEKSKLATVREQIDLILE